MQNRDNRDGDSERAAEILGNFARRLEVAFEQGKAVSPADAPIVAAQRGYAFALYEVVGLLMALGEAATVKRFLLLAEAFVDLSEGITRPLVRAQKDENTPRKGGRYHDQSAVWRVRGTVVLAVQYMRAAGTADDDAFRYATKRLAGVLESAQRTNTRLESLVPNWVRRFEMLEVDDVPAAWLYKFGMEVLARDRMNLSGTELNARAVELIDQAMDDAAVIPNAGF